MLNTNITACAIYVGSKQVMDVGIVSIIVSSGLFYKIPDGQTLLFREKTNRCKTGNLDFIQRMFFLLFFCESQLTGTVEYTDCISERV